MKMTVDKFNERVKSYVWDVLIPDCDDIPTKCAFGAIERSGMLRIGGGGAMVPDSLVAIDKDGAVDIDMIKSMAYGAAEAGGGKVVLRLMRFPLEIPRPALDKFFAYLETGVVQ